MTRTESSFLVGSMIRANTKRPEHFVTVSGRLEPQHPVRPGQGNVIARPV